MIRWKIIYNMTKLLILIYTLNTDEFAIPFDHKWHLKTQASFLQYINGKLSVNFLGATKICDRISTALAKDCIFGNGDNVCLLNKL